MPTGPTIAKLLAALDQIAQIALALTDTDEPEPRPAEPEPPVCLPKALPDRVQILAAETARKHNPANAPRIPTGSRMFAAGELRDEPLRIALITAKYWGPATRQLSVSFMDPSVPYDLRTRIVSHMNAWQCGVTFSLVPGVGLVRISLGPGGYWSYVGTDILHIAPASPTMNLQGFTINTPESEFKRVIRHETGHTLGCPHEHMRQELVDRIDREKAYAWFQLVYGWPRATVDAQVLTPLDEASIMGTPADQTSIMCYMLPRSITKDGKPILGGIDINATDRAFAQGIYPLSQPCQASTREAQAPPAEEEDDASEFVEEAATLG